MKIKIALVIAALAVCSSFCACSSSSNSGNNTENNANTAVSEKAADNSSAPADESGSEDGELADFEDMLKKFEPPANTIKIDMEAEDPSNDEITFTIDGEGKIQNYTYTVNGIKVLMTYDYDYPEEGKLWALAFSEDGTVIGEKTFSFNRSENAKGFSEYEGYYFKGIEIVK